MEIFCFIFLSALAYLCVILSKIDGEKVQYLQAKIRESIAGFLSWCEAAIRSGIINFATKAKWFFHVFAQIFQYISNILSVKELHSNTLFGIPPSK